MDVDTRCSDNGTEALGAEYETEVEVHDRQYQAYSLRHQISLEPIDSVCIAFCLKNCVTSWISNALCSHDVRKRAIVCVSKMTFSN